jgi:hypothetical protein
MLEQRCTTHYFWNPDASVGLKDLFGSSNPAINHACRSIAVVWAFFGCGVGLYALSRVDGAGRSYVSQRLSE